MRRFTLLPAMAAAAMLCSAAFGQIGVRVNGNPVYFNGMRPQEVNGRVLVPLRGVFEQLGAFVDWMPADRTVVASRGNTTIRLPIGSAFATVNGQQTQLDVPATIMAGNTMVPLRFVTEALGADVNWDAGTQTVFIDTGSRIGSVPNSMGNGYNNVPSRDYAPSYQNNGGQAYRQARAHRTSERRAVLGSGTVIPVVLDTPLNSKSSYRGESVSATVRPGNDDAGLPDGTRFQGVVRQATPAANGKPGILDIDFRRIVFPDGATRSLTSSLISLESKDVKRTSDGRLVATGNGAKNNQLLSTLIGAGLGYLYSQTQHARPGDVNLASGTEFGIRIDRPVTFYASAANDTGYDNDRYYRR